MDFKQLTKILYVICYVYAIVTSGPMAEHNNGRLNTIGLGPIGPTPPATHDDVDLFRERSGTLWDFMELYVWGKSSGTLWNFVELYVWGKSSGTLCNFVMGLMERNNYAELYFCESLHGDTTAAQNAAVARPQYQLA